MAQEIINVGTTPNDGQGDPLRNAYIKCNNNFTQLFATSSLPPRIANGASSVNIPQSDGNVVFTVNDIANVVVVTQNSVSVTGAVSASGNITGGNLALSGAASLVGSITGGNVLTGGNVSSSGNVTGGNVLTGGLLSATGNVTGGNLRTTGAITATGNLTSGNIYTSGRISADGNVSGQFIIGDGGFLSNVTVASNVAVSQIANGTTIISIAGSGANATISVGGTGNVSVFASTGQFVSGLLSVTGTVTGGNVRSGGNISATGNVSGGNVLTAGLISSGGNITGANLVTAGLITATGNLTSGNLVTGGVVSADGNVRGGNLLTGGDISATGNVSGFNLNASESASVGGNISAAGNITGTYILGNGSQLTGIVTTLANINNGTSNVTVISSGGNVTTGVGGTANVVVVATTGQYITGLNSISGNVQAGNLRTAGLISATGSITGANITGGNLLTAGLISATGNVTGATLFGTTVSGNLTGTTASLSANITGGNVLTSGSISATGNITGGNLSVGTGIVSVGSIVNNNANAVGNIGSSSKYFNTVFALATSAQYADLAEYYVADAEYEPGTVVKFGGEFEITLAVTDCDPEIAGVISTNPAYAMNTGIKGVYTSAVALQGRVPCKVIGPVRKGQMMVSAGNGYARAESAPTIGTVIGKSLANFDGEQGVIEIVVGRV